MGYAEFGNPQGRPIFLFDGQPGNRLSRYPEDDILATSGIRLITIDRPKKIYLGQISTRLSEGIQRTARRKLFYLDDAEDLQDLLAAPGNRLEKLKGDRAGQYSIRINDQWRIYFEWNDDKASNVEIVDYHG